MQDLTESTFILCSNPKQAAIKFTMWLDDF